MRRNEIFFGYFRDKLSKTLHERPFAYGAQHLHHPISVMLPRQLPETRERKRLKQIGTAYVRSAIPLPPEGEHGVWSGVDGVIDHARKMNTKEWKIGIGHWVNQILYEIPLFRYQLVVLATEGDDFRARIQATEACHAIAKQAGAIDDESGLKLSLRCFDDLAPIHLAQALDARAGLHRSTV